MKVVADKALWDFVETELLKQQSPSAIAGRLGTGLDGLPYASKNSIYRFIESVHGRKIEYARALLKKQTKAKKRRPNSQRLTDRNFIDQRPEIITNRERVGDLEADFIVSGKSGSGALLTAVDRKIRFGFIRRILPVSIANVEQAFLDIRKHFPELTSITIDNDILLQHHKRLEQLLGVPIYFTDPYSSWQKGSIENYNKQVRKYVPKGADISQYSAKYLQLAEDRLNDRFMKVLGYKTPKEGLDEHRLDLKKKTTR